MARGRKLIVEDTTQYKRRGPFELDSVGLRNDPTKDFRWVAPDRIEERKHVHGYDFVRPEGSHPGADTSANQIKVRGMTLMQRPRELAEQSRKRKEALTREQTRLTRERLGEDMERLSSKHGIDLHKLLKDKIEDQ